MNPVFIFLVICSAAIFWFLMAWIFRPLGRLIWKIWDDAIKEITEEDNDKKEKK